jgi:hypothetical protein
MVWNLKTNERERELGKEKIQMKERERNSRQTFP